MSVRDEVLPKENGSICDGDADLLYGSLSSLMVSNSEVFANGSAADIGGANGSFPICGFPMKTSDVEASS